MFNGSLKHKNVIKGWQKLVESPALFEAYKHVMSALQVLYSFI